MDGRVGGADAGTELTLSQDERVELAVEVASGMSLEELTRILHEAATES